MASFKKIVSVSAAATFFAGAHCLPLGTLDILDDAVQQQAPKTDVIVDAIVYDADYSATIAPVPRDLSVCWDTAGDLYNVGGADCTHQCTAAYTSQCIGDCCGESLAICTNDCTYTNMNVFGAMPKCLNYCVGNAVMNACTSDCDTNGAVIDLPLCVSDCKTAGKAPLCMEDCHFYAAPVATTIAPVSPAASTLAAPKPAAPKPSQLLLLLQNMY